MDNVIPLKTPTKVKRKPERKPDMLDRIGRIVQALGTLAIYITGFIVIMVVMAWATYGFNLDWLDWLELGVASVLGVGLYRCAERKAEKIAKKQHRSVEEVMLTRFAEVVLLEIPLIVIFSTFYIMLFLALVAREHNIEIEDILGFFLAQVFGISIVYVYDLLVPLKEVEEDLFEITPDGRGGYRVRATPGARRLFKQRKKNPDRYVPKQQVLHEE